MKTSKNTRYTLFPLKQGPSYMKVKLHQPADTKRDTGICDMRDHRTLELGIRALGKIGTLETSLAQRKG